MLSSVSKIRAFVCDVECSSTTAPGWMRGKMCIRDRHKTLSQNLIRVLAEKNMQLNEKAGFLSQRTTREKLLAYLSAQARRAGSASFRIPFDRQQLADYL